MTIRMRKSRPGQAPGWRAKLSVGLALATLNAVAGLPLTHAASDITLAHVAPFTGPAAIEATEYNAGIKAANAAGGVRGRQLVLRSEDDAYDPDKTVALFRQLAATDTLAALLPVGSPAMTRVLKEQLPESLKLPVVGVVPGAEPLRSPLNPYVYHIRAGDLDQYRKLVDHALTTGLQRVAVAYADIPFGTAGLAAIEATLKKHGKQPVARVAIPIGSNARLPETMTILAGATPDIVLLVSPAQLAGEFVKAYRARGIGAVLGMPSYGNAEALCRIAGDDAARGIVMAQVMPNVANTAIPVVRRFQDDLHKHGEKDMRPSALQLEGYVTTTVLLEALKKTGPAPTRVKLASALDALHRFDTGGFAVEFSPSRHTGSDFVDIGIIGRECRLVF